MTTDRVRAVRDGVRGAIVIAEKDVRIYYAKPPIIMWGVAFPLFLFLSWSVGRGLPLRSQIPALLSIAIFFAASSIGPVVIPWEKRARTFERLLTAPIPLWAVLTGKTLAGMIFGLAVSALVVFAGLVMGTPIMRLGSLVLGIVVSSGTFASLGVLFSTIPTQEVSAVMMPATLVRWPLLFVSGLFVPIDALPAWGRLLAYASPLTYTKDLCEGAMGGAPRLPPLLSFAALLGYWGGFLLLGLLLHEFGRRRT